jgi:hypothetical protein
VEDTHVGTALTLTANKAVKRRTKEDSLSWPCMVEYGTKGDLEDEEALIR